MAYFVSIHRKTFLSIRVASKEIKLPCEVIGSLSLEVFKIGPNVNFRKNFMQNNEKRGCCF